MPNDKQASENTPVGVRYRKLRITKQSYSQKYKVQYYENYKTTIISCTSYFHIYSKKEKFQKKKVFNKIKVSIKERFQ